MSTDYRRPVDAASLAHNFRVFADAECRHEPLYEALSRAIADDDETIALVHRAPYAQRRPVLLFAATHDLLLGGSEHPLAAFYRSVVPEEEWRRDVAQAPAAFFDFCRVHRDALSAMFATHGTQTNEVGRSAGLRLALATLAADRPIALVDVGCSAGLNLLVDRYRFAFRQPHGTIAFVGPESRVVIPSTIESGAPSLGPIPPIARRIGIDRAPLDVNDARDARWLQACVWPSDVDRHRRLAGAIALARDETLDLRRGDAVDRLDDALADLGSDVRPVVFHSWVVSYFDGDARRRFADRVRAMIVERDGAWISAEAPGVVPGLVAPPVPADADATLREATLWHVTTRVGAAADSRCVARSHPHGRWIAWFDRTG